MPETTEPDDPFIVTADHLQPKSEASLTNKAFAAAVMLVLICVGVLAAGALLGVAVRLFIVVSGV
jgi:hypothetical protein